MTAEDGPQPAISTDSFLSVPHCSAALPLRLPLCQSQKCVVPDYPARLADGSSTFEGMSRHFVVIVRASDGVLFRATQPENQTVVQWYPDYTERPDEMSVMQITPERG